MTTKLILKFEDDLIKVLQGRMSKMFFADKWKNVIKTPYKTICDFEHKVQCAMYEARLK